MFLKSCKNRGFLVPISKFNMDEITKMFFFLKKNGPTPASFSFIFGLFKQASLQFLQQIYAEKMSIQYTLPGFEPSTFGTWVSSLYHKTRAPAPITKMFVILKSKIVWTSFCQKIWYDLKNEFLRCVNQPFLGLEQTQSLFSRLANHRFYFNPISKIEEGS